MSTESSELDRFHPWRDVRGVRHQGGYIAKFCPLRVQYDVFPPDGFEEMPADEATQARMQRGIDFEAEVFAELERLHGDAALRLDRSVLRGTAEREAATLAAMSRGVRLILGGRLPTDDVGRRVGEPDVLARAERRGDRIWAYHPIDVKSHLTIDAKKGSAAHVGTLRDPYWSSASVADDTMLRKSTGVDRLQLAHYLRMLEACGHSSIDAVGAIIGSEATLTWIELTESWFERTWIKQKESALEKYDFEFSFRLDVLAAAIDGKSIVEPVRCAECEHCPWREKCIPDLVAADSVSLLPRSTYKQWRGLHRHSLDRRADLAQVEERWVEFVSTFPADIRALQEKAALADVEAPIADVVGRRSTKQIQCLEAAAIDLAGKVAEIPDWVVDLHSQGFKSLVSLWQAARVASWGNGVPHLKPGTSRVEVPSAQVEIDVDMENALDGSVYLWGTLRNGDYLPFASWDADGSRAEEEAFRSFWAWLSPQIEAAANGGPSLAVYIWSLAENRALANGARRADSRSGGSEFSTAANALIESAAYIDLMRVFDRQLMTATGVGLKIVAPMAGFKWRDEDPGGDQSMLRHAAAVDPATSPERSAALRKRLLDYNEDDVRATAAIRQWMRTTSFPHFEELTGPPSAA